MSSLSFFTHDFGDHKIRVVGDGRFSVAAITGLTPSRDLTTKRGQSIVSPL